MKIRGIIVAILVVLISLTSLCQEKKANIYTWEDLSPAMAFLRRQEVQTYKHNGEIFQVGIKKENESSYKPLVTVVESGSGFFVVKENRFFLVTAAHVAKGMEVNSEVVVMGDKGVPISIPLPLLTGQKYPIKWRVHPAADVAAVELKPAANIEKELRQVHFIPFEILVPNYSNPDMDLELTVLGFPEGLGASEKFSPLLLRSLLASGLLELPRFDNGQLEKFLILQNPACGGYSGAPVFDLSRYVNGGTVTTGSGTKCYGLIHGNIADPTGGKLSAFVPSKYVVELIMNMMKIGE